MKSEDLMTATQVDLDRTEASLQGKQEAMNVLKRELLCLMALDTNENDAKDCLVKLEWVEVYAFDAILEQLEVDKKQKEKDVTKARVILQKAEDVANENNNIDNIEAKKKESLLQEDLDSVVADIAQNKLATKQKNAECINLATDLRMISMSKAENFSRLSATRQEVNNIMDIVTMRVHGCVC